MVDEFLTIFDRSDEWIKKYHALHDEQKRNLYLGILSKIQEAFQQNDIYKFEELNKVICGLNEVEENAALIKSTNYITLACKCNRMEILKHLLGKETQDLNDSSTTIQCDQIYKKIFHADETGNTPCYYAIRSNDIDLLETLIDSVNWGSTIMYQSLSNDYASLKLKNVDIHETMQIFVEDRLVRERFLSDIDDARDSPTCESKNSADASRTEVNVDERLNLIINAAKKFNEIGTCPYVQNQRLSIVLFIARNIRILKGQLKSTYSQLPWEEMEFYLSRYSFLPPIERKKMHRHLINFVDNLKSIRGFESLSQENLDNFEALHNDYELMKDEYSLNKMLRYIQLALSVNPDEQSGMLIIQRALHVIGEYVKNSPASPNLSESAQDIFICNEMGIGIDVAPSLRDTLSHIEKLHVLTLRNSIESQQGFFTKLQDDLKRVIGIIVHVFCFVKAKRYKRWCEVIIREDDADEFEELCEGFVEYLQENELPDVEAPEIDALNRAEHLLTVLRIAIYENTTDFVENNIDFFMHEIERHIAQEKKDISNRIMNFNATFRSMGKKIVEHQYNCRLKNRDNDTFNCNTVSDASKMFFKLVFYSLNVPIMSEGIGRMNIISNLINRIQEEKVVGGCRDVFMLTNEIHTALFSKSYFLMFKAIEEFKEKLDKLEKSPSDHNGNIERELDDAFGTFESVLGNEKTFRQFQSSLEMKKEIHKIALKIEGCYEKNKHKLTKREEFILNEELLLRRIEGKKLLAKTPDLYDEFSAGKRDFNKFAGSLRLQCDDEKIRLNAIFAELKSKHSDYSTEFLLTETIRHFKNELTKERYDDLVDKFETIQCDHESRLKLISFYDCVTELEKEEYARLVASLNTTPKVQTDLEKRYKFMNVAYIAESLTDTYGILVKALTNKKSTAEKICNSYVNFLDSLQLNSDTTKLLKTSIINSKVLTILEEQFTKNLNVMKEILGNVEMRQSKYTLISRYRSDEKLQAVVEMLLFDMCNVSMTADALSSKFMATTSRIPMKFLEKGFLYLDGNLPFLKGNSLRNYLAHGDALIDSLPFDSSIGIISSAILFSEEGESLIALRDLAKDDKMAKNLIHQVSNTPDRLLPENLLCDLQLNTESLRTFEKSNYWKRYLMKMLKNSVATIDVCSRYEQFLSQCVSQVSLFTCVNQGDKGQLESLIEAGEEIYSRDSRMKSLLHVAANEGHNDIVEVLLNNGINVDVIDKYYRTSLHLAARNGHGLVVKSLLENGANVDAVDALKNTPLHGATFLKGLEGVACTLMEHGADCDARSRLGATPLQNAAGTGNLHVIKLLVEVYGAKVRVEDNKGNKLLHMAAKGLHNNAEVFEYLLSKDRNSLNCENSSNTTPLCLAVMTGNDNIVEAILKETTASTVNRCNKDLLLVGVLYGNVNIVKMLRDNAANVNDVAWHGCSTALHIASRNGHSQLVKFLIQEKFSVGTKNEQGVTPLHLAAQSGNVETVKVLVESEKCDINTPDNDGVTALHVAAFYNHFNVIKYLLTKNANVNAVDNSGRSLLHRWLANNYNDMKIGDYLIDDLKFDINIRDKTGRTPLAYAIQIGTLNAIKYLVEKKAQLDSRDNNGRTILHFAVVRGNFHLVKYLIRKMTDNIDEIFNAADEMGDNVLHRAVKLGHTNIVNTLLETRNNESFVNSYNKRQITPLFYAIMRGHTSVVEALLDNGADVNAIQNLWTSPLDYAAMFGFEKIVKILLTHNADPNRETVDGGTPLLFASFKNERKIVEILLHGGANVNSANIDGVTALHAAVKSGYYDTAEVLVQWGADVLAFDANGCTPMKYATDEGNWKMHQMLVTKSIQHSNPFEECVTS